MSMKNYKLDPLWMYTAPGLAWDAALKITEQKLDNITDPEMYLMIEKGIRGGVAMISKRHAQANHKYLDNHDPTKESKYIEYLDANNLYGWAMSQPLPTGGFQWMSEKELKHWELLASMGDKGCFLEVDLEYPTELHNLHNEYPLAPERFVPKGGKVEKLIPNLWNKTKYVLNVS